jgi:hypothetical protein
MTRNVLGVCILIVFSFPILGYSETCEECSPWSQAIDECYHLPDAQPGSTCSQDACIHNQFYGISCAYTNHGNTCTCCCNQNPNWPMAIQGTQYDTTCYCDVSCTVAFHYLPLKACCNNEALFSGCENLAATACESSTCNTDFEWEVQLGYERVCSDCP